MDLLKHSSMTFNQILGLVESLAYGTAQTQEHFESFKFTVNMDQVGRLRFARNKSHYRVGGLVCKDFLNEFKNSALQGAISEGLSFIDRLADTGWPYSPGSSSWLVCEFVHPSIGFIRENADKILIIRESCRIDWKGNKSPSLLSERLRTRWFSECPSIDGVKITDNTTVALRNLAGLGIYKELENLLERHLVTFGLGFDSTVQDYMGQRISTYAASGGYGSNSYKIMRALSQQSTLDFSKLNLSSRIKKHALQDVKKLLSETIEQILLENSESLSGQEDFHPGLIVEHQDNKYIMRGKYLDQKAIIVSQPRKRYEDSRITSGMLPFRK